MCLEGWLLMAKSSQWEISVEAATRIYWDRPFVAYTKSSVEQQTLTPPFVLVVNLD